MSEQLCSELSAVLNLRPKVYCLCFLFFFFFCCCCLFRPEDLPREPKATTDSNLNPSPSSNTPGKASSQVVTSSSSSSPASSSNSVLSSFLYGMPMSSKPHPDGKLDFKPMSLLSLGKDRAAGWTTGTDKSASAKDSASSGELLPAFFLLPAPYVLPLPASFCFIPILLLHAKSCFFPLLAPSLFYPPLHAPFYFSLPLPASSTSFLLLMAFSSFRFLCFTPLSLLVLLICHSFFLLLCALSCFFLLFPAWHSGSCSAPQICVQWRQGWNLGLETSGANTAVIKMLCLFALFFISDETSRLAGDQSQSPPGVHISKRLLFSIVHEKSGESRVIFPLYIVTLLDRSLV